MFKFKITPDHHNAIQNLNYYVLPDAPLFSLPSTFKVDSGTGLPIVNVLESTLEWT